VTVGARAPVSTKLIELAIIEGLTTSRHRIARARVTVEFYCAVSFQGLSAARVRGHRCNQADEGKTKESEYRSSRFVHGVTPFCTGFAGPDRLRHNRRRSDEIIPKTSEFLSKPGSERRRSVSITAGSHIASFTY
jgi:hypothetical protein